jgi:hypothetical protein
VERDAGGQVVGRRACTALVGFDARQCRVCKTNFAPGSLTAFRVAAHARAGVKRSWVLRFL